MSIFLRIIKAKGRNLGDACTYAPVCNNRVNKVLLFIKSQKDNIGGKYPPHIEAITTIAK